MMDHKTIKRQKYLFFFSIVLTAVPIILFPLISGWNHWIHGTPRPHNGVLDLAGSDQIREVNIPLDGQWEFYWEQWLVTDGLPAGNPDRMAKLPESWNRYRIGGHDLPQSGYASYRLLLRNCPPNIKLFCYVPYIGAAYRVFLDGQRIAGSGLLSKDPHDKNVSISLQREKPKDSLSSDRELIIEVASNSIGGLYISPILAEYDADITSSTTRYLIALIYVGFLIATIACYVLILCLGANTVRSIALLVLDLLVFLRILMKDEFFGVIKQVWPILSYHRVNVVLSVLTLFLPLLFLLCGRDLVNIDISPRLIRNTLTFELTCCPFMIYFALNGYPKWQNLLCFLSFLPFVAVIRALYRNMKKGVPYSVTVASGMMWVLSCLIVASQTTTGILTINVSMYPATCFVIAVFLQDYIYIRKNADLYRCALEAANLRLRLQETETSLMLSQIKPHFLYNGLLAIQVLCTREPETASDALTKFAKYLRANMQSINSQEPILFRSELEHVRNYVAIEQLRFQNRLTMRYEIGPDSFSVPPLTVQPLVENAIKHGACKKIAGGTVTLRTSEEPDFWCIEILDDGPGFDAAAVLEHPPDDSYGLQNIAFRLERLMNATLTIESQLDHGTRALIRLPKIEEEP